jgi:hypothetical protein
VESNKLLERAAARVNSANASIYPITRVDVNVAEGIRRTLVEQRISTVIIGWSGPVSFSNKIFGGVMDQLLAQTRQQVVVARITRSLNTVKRVLLILPRSAEKEYSFVESMHMVKILSQQLSAPMRLVGPSVGEAKLRELVASTPPERPIHYLATERLRDIPQEFEGKVHEDDLIILLSARDHRISWTPYLEAMPSRLADAFPETPLLVVYAAEGDTASEDALHGSADDAG